MVSRKSRLRENILDVSQTCSNPGNESLLAGRSAIIDDLMPSCTSMDCPISYTYFDYKSQDSQTSIAVFSSILRQILAFPGEIPKPILDTYNQRSIPGPDLTEHEMRKFILSLVASARVAYIVIDALDECVADHRERILNFLQELKANHKIRILTTSRQHVQDINDGLKTEGKVLIEADSEDLSKYISHRLRDPKLRDKVDNSLSQKIAKKLLETAGGM